MPSSIFFTTAAHWAEVTIPSKSCMFVCLWLLDSFLKTSFVDNSYCGNVEEVVEEDELYEGHISTIIVPIPADTPTIETVSEHLDSHQLV